VFINTYEKIVPFPKKEKKPMSETLDFHATLDEAIGPTNLESLRAYVQTKRPTGDFLHAVLTNDLMEACCRADSQNRYLIFDIVNWLYNRAPAQCWGSVEKVERWLRNK
jgi:hypothetical protein